MLRAARLKIFLLGVLLGSIVGYVYAQTASQKPATALANIDWSKAEHVRVVMSDYQFTPERLNFHHGVPTRLRLINDSGSLHDFTAAYFLKTVDLRDPGVMASSGIGITVEPHQQKDVDLIARLPGHFGLICADHDWAGMTANILVE
jgi:uncharacterized cupredoxin-like copper-binding protein